MQTSPHAFAAPPPHPDVNMSGMMQSHPPHPPHPPHTLMPPQLSQPMEGIADPHHNDVLCGRGVTTNRHKGNENFRGFVNRNKVKKVMPIFETVVAIVLFICIHYVQARIAFISF